MKESVLSCCEKSFILNAISENVRLDGRALDEFRDLKIHFGNDWGCVLVTLGDTKVIAQISCDVQQPKPTRPNEGLLLIFMELSPMAAQHFETGRQLDVAVQLNRLLEKCIKDSHCVDLESLCIVAEEKVWALQVHISVLNHEGNLIDAASVAALTALSHFRRPDVTITGEQISIHTAAERDLLSISLHHYPVCVSYVIFDGENRVVADPTVIEERVSNGLLVFGVNAGRELCTIHLGGRAKITSPLILQYAAHAAERALEVVTQIKEALAVDLEKRNSGTHVGFQECTEHNSISLRKEKLHVQLPSHEIKDTVQNMIKKEITEEGGNGTSKNGPAVFPIGVGSAELIDRKHRTMKLERRKKLYKYDMYEYNSGESIESSFSEVTSDTSEITSDTSDESEKTEESEERWSLEEHAVEQFEKGGSKSDEKKITITGERRAMDETVNRYGDDLRETPIKGIPKGKEE